MDRIGFKLEVPIGQDWRNVELLRSAILNCLAAVFQNNDFCETVGMVTGELLENAIKYGAWERGDRSRFGLRVFGAIDGVHVEVTNPVEASGADLALLRQTLEKVAGFPSPQEAYFARLRELAEAPPGSTASRLGLTRIAYEGNCSLTVEEVTPGVITIEAVLRP